MLMILLSGIKIHEADISMSVCILCNEAMKDRTGHVLFQCNRTRNELRLLQQEMPHAMWVQFDTLGPTGKTVFIASRLNKVYLAELDHIYSTYKCYHFDLFL